MARTIAEKRAAFRALHSSGCFMLPNPWDVGSARYLESLGFQALATTSSGFAWSTGRPDNTSSRDAVLEHFRTMVEATDLPINADFENGMGRDCAEVGENVRLAIATGIAGLSIEDSTGDPANALFPIDVAVSRLAAARRAIDASGEDVLLIGRAENFFSGVHDLNDTAERLKAYSKAGADCLYAPGIHTREQIETLVNAVAPKPFNLLISSASAFSQHDIAALGVRRISVGGALARTAWGGFMRAAQSLAGGSFDGLSGAASGKELNELFESHR